MVLALLLDEPPPDHLQALPVSQLTLARLAQTLDLLCVLGTGVIDLAMDEILLTLNSNNMCGNSI